MCMLCSAKSVLLVSIWDIFILVFRFGDDWKKSLQLPQKDMRVKTSVS